MTLMKTALLAAGLVLTTVPVLPALADTGEVAASELPARHAAWTELLSRYVVESEDGINRFDYGGLNANTEHRAALDTYIDSFTTLEFGALTPDEGFAAWSNLYNAVTVRHILDRYPVRSIRTGYIIGPWKEVKTIAGGREVSLDDIEHKILRVEWSDPRVHYAVNCAALGCPNLQTRAWEAATLDADLDAAARAYVNDPRGVQIRSRGGLKVSRIYKWFIEDFGDSEAGVIAHLELYAEPELKAAIAANRDIRQHAYDWSLNDVE